MDYLIAVTTIDRQASDERCSSEKANRRPEAAEAEDGEKLCFISILIQDERVRFAERKMTEWTESFDIFFWLRRRQRFIRMLNERNVHSRSDGNQIFLESNNER